MHIERLTNKNRDELRNFLDSVGRTASGAMVLGYHYPENIDMLLEVLQPGAEMCFFGARDDKGALVGVLPGIFKRSGELSCYNSLPFFGPNAGVIADIAGPRRYAEVASALTEAAIEFARTEGAVTAVFYTPFNPARLELVNPALTRDGAIRIPRETLYLKLPDSDQHKWDKNIAYDLRKAEKAGMQLLAGISSDDTDRVFQIYARNCEDYGIPAKPRECIEHLVRVSQGSSRILGYSAKLDGKVIAALLVWHAPQTVSYYLPCTDPEFRTLQPGSLLIDHAVREAARKGLKYWNWERSPEKMSGVYHFKKKWGSEEAFYDVVVVPTGNVAALREAGADEVARRFPFFFVYPFDQL